MIKKIIKVKEKEKKQGGCHPPHVANVSWSEWAFIRTDEPLSGT